LLEFLIIMYSPVFSYPSNVSTQSKTEVDSINSRILRVKRMYSVYLPKSYYTDKNKKFPVLYLLHGLHDNNKGWLDGGNLKSVADSIVDIGKACEMIIIIPDAGSLKNGYFDTEGWPYETFFFNEFVPSVEKKYRIISDKQHRAIAGYSMGGGGATSYALKHPEMFSSVYAMSALMTLPKQNRVAVMDNEMKEFGQSVLANNCIDYVAAIDEAGLENLRKIRWFVDCGDDDFLLEVNFRFFQEMKEAKVPCQLRVRDGDHNWKYWQESLCIALPFISEGFLDSPALKQTGLVQ